MLLQKRGSKMRIMAFLLIVAMVACLLPPNVQTVSAATTGKESQNKTVKTIITESEDGTAHYVEAVSDAQTVRKAKASEETNEDLPQLTTPVNLQWQTEVGTGREEVPGMIFWDIEEGGKHQERFRVDIYRTGEDEPVKSSNWVTSSNFRSSDFIISDFDSGTYYFTVQTIGDGKEYSNSDIARSEEWTYTKPNEKLELSFNDLQWNWPEFSWKSTANEDEIWGYDIEGYFLKTQDDEIKSPVHHTWGVPSTNGRIDDSTIAANGNGYYFFRVRALSKDITKYQNSDWSEYSDSYNLNTLTGQIKEQLEDLKDEADVEQIKQTVQAMDKDGLRSAMLADDSVVELVKALESKTQVATDVQLDDSITEELKSEFNSSDVSMVGATLNDLLENVEKVTLKIGNPEKEDLVIPDNYGNSMAVKFSMNAEGIVNTEQLAVPIRITLPIPSTINPAFLTILHYDQEGKPEILDLSRLYIYQSDGKWLVSFVLDHFSDFAMVQQLPVITFDANGGICDTSTLTVNEEGLLENLPIPTREGYTFVGWYNGENKAEVTTKFVEDTTLTAKWEQDAASDPTTAPSTDPTTPTPTNPVLPTVTPTEPTKPSTNPTEPSATPTEPSVTPSEPDTPTTEKPSTPTPVKQGTTVQDSASNAFYVVTKTGNSASNNTVTYKKPKDSKKTAIIVPATIKIAGKTYQVTKIANNAFKNNSKIKTIKIGANIQIIGAKAFNKCSNLKSIVIPSKVTTIQKGAFANCKNLKSITIKTTKLTKKSVRKNAFKGTAVKAKVKTPTGKVTTYKKLLQSKGLSKKATVK